jgi:hypothetical protein
VERSHLHVKLQQLVLDLPAQQTQIQQHKTIQWQIAPTCLKNVLFPFQPGKNPLEDWRTFVKWFFAITNDIKVLQSALRDDPGCTPHSNGAITRPTDPEPNLKSKSITQSWALFFFEMRIAWGFCQAHCLATARAHWHLADWRHQALWSPPLLEGGGLQTIPAQKKSFNTTCGTQRLFVTTC